MFDFKLQLGCLIILLYIIALYIKYSYDKRIKCNRIFDALMFTVPWAVFFDGVTAWSVNHLDVCPYRLNLILHAAFLVMMNVVSMLIFFYMLDVTIGLKNKKKAAVLTIPTTAIIIVTLVTINKLEFIHGKTTNYSMGLPVKISFAMVFLHFLLILLVLVARHRTLEKKKIMSIISFMAICVICLTVQIIYPEVLISSLVPTLTIIGIYVNFEDPSEKRLQIYNEDMVTGFATLVENRDNNTGGHIKRTKEYVRILLKQMQKCDKYTFVLTRDYRRNVIQAAPMHDIGKISTPDYILQKPDKLTDDEYDIMKKHSPIGGEIIKDTFADIDEPEFQKIAYEVARYHHEKWNGRGYPDGLSGEEIPLHARIMAIADVFDAVSAKRVYRDAMPLDKCFKIIEEGAGKDFDPDLAELFLNAKDTITQYYNNNKD